MREGWEFLMKKATELVQRVERQYVGDDCVQIMLPYDNSITFLGEQGILYHHVPESSFYVNRYLEDERRKQFPYSNIPTHYSRVGLFKKKSFVNQILDFEKPYFRIGDGYCCESFAVKDSAQALLVHHFAEPSRRVEHLTYEELMEFVSSDNSCESVYYVNLDGSLKSSKQDLFPTEERIHRFIQKHLQEDMEAFLNQKNNFSSSFGNYLRRDPWFSEYIQKVMSESLDLSFVDFNIPIETSFLVVRTMGDRITLQGLDVKFVHQDDYRVEIYDIPVTRYRLEQLKFVPKVCVSREPKILLRLNPGVSKEDILAAKKMVKELREKWK